MLESFHFMANLERHPNPSDLTKETLHIKVKDVYLKIEQYAERHSN
jgi:hypothetical protein